MPTSKPTKNDHKHKVPLKLIFFYILTFAALYTALVSYLNLLFAYVNVKLPESLAYTVTSSLNRIRLSTSILIVVWLLYLFTQWLIAKDLKNYKEQPERSGKKLLTYLTLLMATVTIAVDLITLIYNFYSGGFTTPFMIKVFSVLVVAAVVFEYHRWDLRQKFGVKTNARRNVAIAATVVLIASVVIGFFIVGSPTKQRNIRFDETRVQNLQEIQSQIISHWQLKGKLPAKLSDLTDSISGYQVPSDPETGVDYDYTKTGNTTFTLCATFKTDGTSQSSSYISKPVAVDLPLTQEGSWTYKVGKSCYDRTIDPDIYKPADTTK